MANRTLPNAQPTVAGGYDVVVTNSAGTITSNTVSLMVNVAPAITTQPVSATVNPGQSVTFTVSATGTPAPTYQWRKASTTISGATNASLTLANAQTGDAGSYDVVVTNSAGSVSSGAATLTVNVPPAITLQPIGATLTITNVGSFWVTATGTAPLSYQWRKNGGNIAGATNALYILGEVQLSDAGSYDVVVTNSAGSVISSAASLAVVIATPVVPTATTVGLTSLTMSWTAVPGATLYEVQRYGLSQGTTSATSFAITGLQPATDQVLAVRARDAAGNWSGWSDSLTVATAPDTVAPDTPVGLSVSSQTMTSLRLSWNAAYDNIGTVAYEVRDANGDSLGMVDTTFIDLDGLEPGITYQLQVRATDAADRWSNWSSAYAAATLPDITAPSMPTDLAAPAGEQRPTYEVLHWTASTDDVGVAGYDICIALDGHPSTDVHDTTTGTSYILAGLQPSTNYYVKIRARDAAGHTSAWTAELFTATPPEVPAGQARPAWVDVNGDGIRDEVLPSGVNAVVNFDFSFWDFYDGYYSPWDPYGYWNNYNAWTSDGSYYGGFQSIWDWPYYNYTFQTTLDVTAIFDPRPNYTYGIYEDTTGSATILPGNLSPILTDIAGGSGATQYISLGTFYDYELYNRRFYTVRYGLAPKSARILSPTGTVLQSISGETTPPNASTTVWDVVLGTGPTILQAVDEHGNPLVNGPGGSWTVDPADPNNPTWKKQDVFDLSRLPAGSHTIGMSENPGAPANLRVIVWFKINVIPPPKPLKIVLEPITLSGGVNALRNPSGFEVDTQATFEISWPGFWRNPADNDVTWTATGPVSFLNGVNKGKVVTIVGTAVGDATLQVSVAGRAGPTPTVTTTVFAKSTVRVFVHVARRTNHTDAVATQTQITVWLAGANKVFKQAAMEFVQDGAIAYQDNDAYQALISRTLPGRGSQEYPKAIDMMREPRSGMGGLHMYFVGSLEGLVAGFSTPTLGVVLSVEKLGIAKVLAHELGHACGLKDIYIEHKDPASGTVTALNDDKVKPSWLPLDWPGGPGPEYYKSNLLHKFLVSGRLLMYGVSDGTNEDAVVIPRGPVYGVSRDNIAQPLNVGLFISPGVTALTRNPTNP